LHPFMPFLTEEIWHLITERNPENALIVSNNPKKGAINQQIIEEFEIIKEVISKIRTLRKEKNISFKQSIELSFINSLDLPDRYNAVVSKMGNISTIQTTDSAIDGALTFRVKSNEYFVPIGDTIDIEEELKKLREELNYTEGFLKSVQKKLSNERFVNNAPKQVVDGERKKESDALAKIKTIKASIETLCPKN
ncbi:MAG: class I tRNA ligase family protein, partial [Bacteroidota bacterium]